MTSPSKIKGSRWEREVADYLSQRGWPDAERTRAGWQDDRGDIAGVPFVVECKSARTIDLAGWTDETIKEAANAAMEYGVLVIKRRGKGDPGEAYAVMRLAEWVDLAHEAGL